MDSGDARLTFYDRSSETPSNVQIQRSCHDTVFEVAGGGDEPAARIDLRRAWIGAVQAAKDRNPGALALKLNLQGGIAQVSEGDFPTQAYFIGPLTAPVRWFIFHSPLNAELVHQSLSGISTAGKEFPRAVHVSLEAPPAITEDIAVYDWAQIEVVETPNLDTAPGPRIGNLR